MSTKVFCSMTYNMKAEIKSPFAGSVIRASLGMAESRLQSIVANAIKVGLAGLGMSIFIEESGVKIDIVKIEE